MPQDSLNIDPETNTMPLTDGLVQPDPSNPAANVIRDKVARVYASEPDASTEQAEANASKHRSKHQQFMYELSNSGKDLASIQTEWHKYYVDLPNQERHQVWQEFYSSQSSVTQSLTAVTAEPTYAQTQAEHKHAVVKKPRKKTAARIVKDLRSPQAIQASIRHNVTGGGKLGLKHHVHSLLFGLAMGSVVVVIFLFSFFNEVIIAPLIQPSRVAAATPLIITANSVAPSSKPEVIIPKINVQIPIDFDETSLDEAALQKGLERGVVHYPTTVRPGENGNGAYFGHSSNNILNPGKYKFAFVLLHTLVPGDTFYLTYNSKVYVYKVITRTVVDPSNVGVLGPVPGQTATATLITCDPPGTSLKRLVVVGQQISPAVSGNSTPASQTVVADAATSNLPGNGPTLPSRVLHAAAGKITLVILILAAIIATVRWIRKPLKR